MSKLCDYSVKKLQTEIKESYHRLEQYEEARKVMPSSSLLGSIAIASGIKYELARISKLEAELEKRNQSVFIEVD